MNNIARIREELLRRGLDAVLVTDEKNQRYAAGFPFTDGAVLVGREKAFLLTDSRYIEAAEKAADELVSVRLFDREHPLTARLQEALAETGAEKVAAEDQKLSHAGFLGWEKKLEPVYPVHVKEPAEKPNKYSFKAEERKAPAIKVAKPKVLIPVFPGTNCEYDTARQFEKAGAEAEIFVVRNLSEQAIKESVDAMEKKIKQSQIVMLPGGFSGGDEPDGSGKFIVSFLRNPKLTDAIHDLLKNRDGLMLGICNGFQALVKLGLVPYGEIVDMRDDSPTLTFNTIARHQSKMVNTRIASNKSPWLAACEVDDIHSIAISHGEGRFFASAEEIAKLAANGQIATQYVDFDGEPTFDIHCNPNTSFDAIEGITSPDGRVLGKMGHSERMGNGVCINVPGAKDQKIFESGVKYFK